MTFRDLGECIAAFVLVFLPLYGAAWIKTLHFLAMEAAK